jgi:hypothetical protein
MLVINTLDQCTISGVANYQFNTLTICVCVIA